MGANKTVSALPEVIVETARGDVLSRPDPGIVVLLVIDASAYQYAGPIPSHFLKSGEIAAGSYLTILNAAGQARPPADKSSMASSTNTG